MQTITKFSASILAITFAACGSPDAPPGPHGGDNRFDVTLNDEPESFDSIALTLTQTGTSALVLRAVGSVDPVENAIDDEYSLNLELVLDPAELSMVSLPADLLIDLTTNFAAEDLGGERDPLGVAPQETHSPVVRSILLSRSCFCGGHPAGSQRATGSLKLVANDAKGLQGSLQLDLEGQAPFMNDIDAKIDVVFDLAPSR